jgi:hypothetical protein
MSSSGSSASTSKHVSFSEYSSLSIYPVDPLYRRHKSYSKSDFKSFRDRAVFTAYQIRQFIASSSLQSADAIRLLIANQVISSETLIGIEDLIGDSSITPEDRRAHSELVIKMQSTLKSSKEKDPNLLAKVAAVRSAGSVRRARDKALLAAAA